MIAATIDIGTNTTLALLAESDGDDMRILRDMQTPNRLGESLADGDNLSAQSIALNIDLLGEIVRDFRREGAQDFAVCGTSALRKARNREEFVEAVRDVLHLGVDVLSGSAEATLTFAGAVSSRNIPPREKIGVIDLGGGSTEVIEGQGHVPGHSCSLDIGAVCLTNQFFAEEIPSAAAIGSLRLEVQRRLRPLLTPLSGDVYPWMLVGGTAVTLAMLKQKLYRYDPQKIGGSTLSLSDLQKQSDSFFGKHPDELQTLPGMPLNRGRYILAGTLLMMELFSVLQITEGAVTERGLRHGLWLAKFMKREI